MNQLKSNGASNTLFEHSRPNKTDSSRFDLSRLINATYDPGMILPIDCFEVYPGDVLDIDLISAIDTLPLVSPSLTQYKFVTHWYYMKKRDTWKGFKTLSTRGRSGNVNDLFVPKIDTQLPYNSTDKTVSNVITYDSVNSVLKKTGGDLSGSIYFDSSHSLLAALGCTPRYNSLLSAPDTSSTSFSDSSTYLPYTFVPSGSDSRSSAYKTAISTEMYHPRYVSALPFVMYQSICKNNYVNQNLLQENHSLFPEEGDDDWILGYNANITNFIDVDNNTDLPEEIVYNYDGVYTYTDNVTRLDQLRYAMFEDDYFTTGLPWLQRGKAPTLDADFIDDASVYASTDIEGYEKLYGFISTLTDTTQQKIGIGFGDGSGDTPGTSFLAGLAGFNTTFTHATVDQNLISTSLQQFPLKAELTGTAYSFSLNQFRQLVAMSVWQERNARVNGSYNAMIYQHWNVNPHSEEHQPIYIGGTADYIDFSSIIQQSESSSSSPLGTQAGYGSKPSSSSKVCQSFKVDDYGFIMGVMIIKPLTYYQQGIERYLLTPQGFNDVIYPEFQGLSPEPIYLGEIYNGASLSDVSKDLFNYQERMTYAKVRQNVNRGLFQCSPRKDILFSSMTQARWFDTRPEFSYQFVCMSPDNMRRDHLAFPSLPMFRCQFLSNVFVNRRLSYTSEPETFGF